MSTQQPYKGITRFKSEAAAKQVQRLTEKLPNWLLIIGLLFRFAFLSVIIPELWASFSQKEMGTIPFFVVTVLLACLAEILFSLTSLANPSLFMSENTRRWGFVVLGFGGIGLIYNGLEMYWFVEDYLATLAHPEKDAIKPHIFLQMCNILSWFATETAGFMLLTEGLAQMKEERKVLEITKQEQAIDSKKTIPAYLMRVNSDFYMIDWGDGNGVEQQPVNRIASNLSTAKTRANKTNSSENARVNFERWQFVAEAMSHATEGVPIINTAGLEL